MTTLPHKIDKSLIQTEEQMLARWGEYDKPLVSINCITYNHENYIRDALDGFLIQQTDFPFEILIHDDASTDGTADIVREYEKKYPNIIKPLYQTVNQFSQGKRVGILNAQRARGEYIAFCEGDDYWISIDKLQKQAEFLSENPEYSAITHQTIKFFEDNRAEPQLFTCVEKNNWELDDLMFGRKYHTASLMARGDIFRKHRLPEGIVSGDKAFSFLLLTYGKIKYFNEAMAVYRKNEGGISSWVTAELMAGDLKLLPWLKRINPEFPINKYKSIIYSTVFAYPPKIRALVALKYYLLFSIFSFSYFPKNLRLIVSHGKRLLSTRPKLF